MSSPPRVYKHYLQSTQPLQWPLLSPPDQHPPELRIDIQAVAIPNVGTNLLCVFCIVQWVEALDDAWRSEVCT
jgi:hypothetical protein